MYGCAQMYGERKLANLPGSVTRQCVNNGTSVPCPVTLVRHASLVRRSHPHHFSDMLFFCFLVTRIEISGILYSIQLSVEMVIQKKQVIQISVETMQLQSNMAKEQKKTEKELRKKLSEQKNSCNRHLGSYYNEFPLQLKMATDQKKWETEKELMKKLSEQKHSCNRHLGSYFNEFPAK